MATKKKDDAKKESPKQKTLGKCASFIHMLKDSKNGLTWEEVEKAGWNSNGARYPATFKSLVDKGEAYKAEGKMFYGKAPLAKKSNGKDSKKGDNIPPGTV